MRFHHKIAQHVDSISWDSPKLDGSIFPSILMVFSWSFIGCFIGCFIWSFIEFAIACFTWCFFIVFGCASLSFFFLCFTGPVTLSRLDMLRNYVELHSMPGVAFLSAWRVVRSRASLLFARRLKPEPLTTERQCPARWKAANAEPDRGVSFVRNSLIFS